MRPPSGGCPQARGQTRGFADPSHDGVLLSGGLRSATADGTESAKERLRRIGDLKFRKSRGLDRPDESHQSERANVGRSL